MIVRVLALVALLLAWGPTAWAEGEGGDAGRDGAAQRLPFSQEARGTRRLEPLPEPKPLPEIKPLSEIIKPIDELKPIEIKPLEIKPLEIKPLETDKPSTLTLKEEVTRIHEGMLEALAALQKLDDAKLERGLAISVEIFQPDAHVFQEYLGPRQGALSQEELEAAEGAFANFLRTAARQDDPRAALQRLEGVLSRPGYLAEAIEHAETQHAAGRGIHEPVTARIEQRIQRAANESESGGASGQDRYERLPRLAGYPDFALDPYTDEVFRKVGNYWVPVPDPR